MIGYVPLRTKASLAPWLLLLALLFIALGDAGVLGSTGTKARRPHATRLVPGGLTFTSGAGCQPARDWRSGQLDSRVRQLLLAASRYKVRASCLHTGHSHYVKGTDRVSNHTVWRAVDIDRVAGRPVSPGNPAAKRLALAIGRGELGARPSEVGSPWSFGRRPWFTDPGHKGHLHVGFAALRVPTGIPPAYLRLYREAGAGEVWVDRAGRRYQAWAVLAGIGAQESGHGQSRAAGVHSGVNFAGCCAGPMQFNLTDGPPSTWQQYGRGSVYDPRDAIPAAARKLRAQDARRDLDGALLAYNRLWSYVRDVKTQARTYQKGV